LILARELDLSNEFSDNFPNPNLISKPNLQDVESNPKFKKLKLGEFLECYLLKKLKKTKAKNHVLRYGGDFVGGFAKGKNGNLESKIISRNSKEVLRASKRVRIRHRNLHRKSFMERNPLVNKGWVGSSRLQAS